MVSKKKKAAMLAILAVMEEQVELLRKYIVMIDEEKDVKKK